MLDYGEWWYSEMRHIKLIAKKKKKDKVKECLSWMELEV